MVKWMIIDYVFHYTLDSINRRRQDRAGPIHEFRKGSLFSGQLPPPQKLVPRRFGPGSGDAEVVIQTQREELGSSSSSIIQYPITCPWRGRLQPWTLSRGEFNLPKIPFTLQDRWQHNIDINSVFPQRWCTTMIWFYLLNWWRHLKVAAFITSPLDFMQKTRISKWGNFSFMVKSRKQIYEFVFIGSLFLHSKSQCWANAGRWNSRFHECMV